jgi:hypothetical protein
MSVFLRKGLATAGGDVAAAVRQEPEWDRRR